MKLSSPKRKVCVKNFPSIKLNTYFVTLRFLTKKKKRQLGKKKIFLIENIKTEKTDFYKKAICATTTKERNGNLM